MTETDATVHPNPETKERYPQVVNLGTFTVTVRGLGEPAAEQLEAEYLAAVRRDLLARMPLVLFMYDVEFHRENVWHSDRKARYAARLRRKTGALVTGLAVVLGLVASVLAIASTDFDKVQGNFEAAKEAVLQRFKREGRPIDVDPAGPVCAPDVGSPAKPG